MTRTHIRTSRYALPFDLDTDELNAKARACSSLVSFEDKTEPAPSFDTTTIIDNAPLV